jgi:hypothetical protein
VTATPFNPYALATAKPAVLESATWKGAAGGVVELGRWGAVRFGNQFAAASVGKITSTDPDVTALGGYDCGGVGGPLGAVDDGSGTSERGFCAWFAWRRRVFSSSIAGGNTEAATINSTIGNR